MSRCVATFLAVAGIALLGGCGAVRSDVAVAQGDAPTAKPYTGPLKGKNVAAKALECDGKVFAKGLGLNPQEDIKGSSTPEGAVENWDGDAMPFDHPVARDGYALAARDTDRALFTWTYRGKVRSVAIAVNDKNPDTYLKGWGVLEAAWCNPAEFPAELDTNHWYEIWTDRDGDRVDTRTLHSTAGSDHCSWQSAQFLFMDAGKDWYVRDPEGLFARNLGEKPMLAGEYLADTKVPKDATDTGYQRDGKHIHLTDEAAYVRYDDGHVEAWPLRMGRWGCV